MLYVLLCKLYSTLMFYRYSNTTHIVAGYEQNDRNLTRGHYELIHCQLKRQHPL